MSDIPPMSEIPLTPPQHHVHGELKRVLLVDDVPVNLKVFSAMVRKFDLEVLTANSAAEAMEVIRETKVDLILTDLWMAGVNGVELTLSARELFPEIPVVAVTADIDAGNSVFFDLTVFDSIMTKPVTLQKLQDLLVYICDPTLPAKDWGGGRVPSRI